LMQMDPLSRSVAIACGGTGGHLFPGLAVAAQLVQQQCAVTLLVSPKEVDQEAVKAVSGMEVVALPAVALNRGGWVAFMRGFARSYRAVKARFAFRPPQAVLAMGGFTSAPPVLAGKRGGAATFLQESNTIPGRANRWLSLVADQAFVGFPDAAARLHRCNVAVTGTPVRAQFRPRDPAACRAALHLEPNHPVLLVMGGSQGASGINEMVIQALPLLTQCVPGLQCIHLTGSKDAEKVRQAWANLKARAAVHPFFADMELALGAATVAICRAGASSLAELAAMRVPAVLVPFPTATDNHQFCNARAFEKTGAARLLEQKQATPELLSQLILELVANDTVRSQMRAALERWHHPHAAEQIAQHLVQAMTDARPAADEARGAGRSARWHPHQSAVP
jgi:UDP-N-acetylglucosamine--N-acetylmuramyl-(pentapeptide) pyrophosphoryl-undecaprenol N-acetylglucosamine transferase